MSRRKLSQAELFIAGKADKLFGTPVAVRLASGAQQIAFTDGSIAKEEAPDRWTASNVPAFHAELLSVYQCDESSTRHWFVRFKCIWPDSSRMDRLLMAIVFETPGAIAVLDPFKLQFPEDDPFPRGIDADRLAPLLRSWIAAFVEITANAPPAPAVVQRRAQAAAASA